MDENRIVIVKDDGNIIDFEDVTIKRDSVDRNEVAEIESEISNLVNQRASIDERLVKLNDKLSYAKKVIALADEKKARQETEQYLDANSDIIQETEVESGEV